MNKYIIVQVIVEGQTEEKFIKLFHYIQLLKGLETKGYVKQE